MNIVLAGGGISKTKSQIRNLAKHGVRVVRHLAGVGTAKRSRWVFEAPDYDATKVAAVVFMTDVSSHRLQDEALVYATSIGKPFVRTTKSVTEMVVAMRGVGLEVSGKPLPKVTAARGFWDSKRKLVLHDMVQQGVSYKDIAAVLAEVGFKGQAESLRRMYNYWTKDAGGVEQLGVLLGWEPPVEGAVMPAEPASPVVAAVVERLPTSEAQEWEIIARDYEKQVTALKVERDDAVAQRDGAKHNWSMSEQALNLACDELKAAKANIKRLEDELLCMAPAEKEAHSKQVKEALRRGYRLGAVAAPYGDFSSDIAWLLDNA
jgi:hypothetical protein